MVAEHPFGHGAALWDALAQALCRRLQSAIDARGRASFVVTGGLTPGPLYDVLAHGPVDWSRIEITLSDERWVAPTDPASNEGLVRRRLLVDRAAAAKFVPLKSGAPTPEAGLAEIDARLSALSRPFDVVLLGVGEDGHVASLFPGASLDEPGIVQAVHAPGAFGTPRRISLTMRELRAARALVLLFAGERKLAVYRAARDGASDTPLAALLRGAPADASAYWLEETS